MKVVSIGTEVARCDPKVTSLYLVIVSKEGREGLAFPKHATKPPTSLIVDGATKNKVSLSMPPPSHKGDKFSPPCWWCI